MAGPAVETVEFGLDGGGYELDLSAANAAGLRAALGRYVAAARRVDDPAPGRPGTARTLAVRAMPRAAARR